MDKEFDRGLLKAEFCFYGKHARMVQQIKETISTEVPIPFFSSTVEILIAASRIGILEGKTGKADKSTSETAKILADQMNQHSVEISRNFRLIMLLHERETIGIQERLERAFLSDNKLEKRKSLEEIFFSYVLGGLECIHSSIFGNKGAVKDIDEAIRNTYSFIEKVNGYRGIYSEKISDMIKGMGDDD